MCRTNSCPTCRSLLLQNDGEDMGKQGAQQLLDIQFELDNSLRYYPITYNQTGFTYTVQNSGGESLWNSAGGSGGGSSGGGASGGW